MGKDKGKSKPETKAQRDNRRDQSFSCDVCPASYRTAAELGTHKIMAHPADNA